MQKSTPMTATSYPSIVGGVLAQLRGQQGLRQEDLAQAIGITQTTMSRVETGQSSLTIDHLSLAARHLGIAPNQILAYADYNETSFQNRGIEVFPTRQTLDPEKVMIFLGGAVLATLITLAVVNLPQS